MFPPGERAYAHTHAERLSLVERCLRLLVTRVASSTTCTSFLALPAFRSKFSGSNTLNRDAHKLTILVRLQVHRVTARLYRVERDNTSCFLHRRISQSDRTSTTIPMGHHCVDSRVACHRRNKPLRVPKMKVKLLASFLKGSRAARWMMCAAYGKSLIWAASMFYHSTELTHV